MHAFKSSFLEWNCEFSVELAQHKSPVFLAAKNRLNLLKNQANFPVSSTLLPHSWFDSYKSLIFMRKIFLKRILWLFKKVSWDEECVEKNCTRKVKRRGIASGFPNHRSSNGLDQKHLGCQPVRKFSWRLSSAQKHVCPLTFTSLIHYIERETHNGQHETHEAYQYCQAL